MHALHPQPHAFISAADDFASTSVTCTRSLGSTSQEITCSFVITQDNILESDEILVVALSVAVDAGNVINLGDNCALAIISPGTSQGTKYTKYSLIFTQHLQTMQGFCEF